MFHRVIPCGGSSNLYGLRLSQSSNLRIADDTASDTGSIGSGSPARPSISCNDASKFIRDVQFSRRQ
jgi:hypothetical protein